MIKRDQRYPRPHLGFELGAKEGTDPSVYNGYAWRTMIFESSWEKLDWWFHTFGNRTIPDPEAKEKWSTASTRRYYEMDKITIGEDGSLVGHSDGFANTLERINELGNLLPIKDVSMDDPIPEYRTGMPYEEILPVAARRWTEVKDAWTDLTAYLQSHGVQTGSTAVTAAGMSENKRSKGDAVSSGSEGDATAQPTKKSKGKGKARADEDSDDGSFDLDAALEDME